MNLLQGYSLKPSSLALILLMSVSVFSLYILATNRSLSLYVPEMVVTDGENDMQSKTTEKIFSNNKPLVQFHYPSINETNGKNNDDLLNRSYKEAVTNSVDNSKEHAPRFEISQHKMGAVESTIQTVLTTEVTNTPVTSSITTTSTVSKSSSILSSYQSSMSLSTTSSKSSDGISQNSMTSAKSPDGISQHSMTSANSPDGLSQQLRDDNKARFKLNGNLNDISVPVFHNKTFSNESKDTVNKTKDDNAALQQIHKERIQTIQNACNKGDLSKNNPYQGKNVTYIYMTNKYNFSYCKVPKSGSTFWTQAFGVLEYGLNYGKTIFNKSRASVHSTMGKYLVSFTKVKTEKSPTVLVSRDPYSRLYSAYIDKSFLTLMFSINYKIRNITDYKQCPTNVTFKEFLDWIILDGKRGATLNRHWAPIVSLCRPCDLNAFILVKQESFATDVEFALRKFQVEEDKFKYIVTALHGHRIELTIPGIIATIYARMTNHEVRNCFTYPSLARRVWNSLQIQGYINENIPFPEEKFVTISTVTKSSYLSDIVLETIREHPLSSQQTKQQRYRYLYDAYSSIKLETIQGIQDLYKHDFEVFGYSKIPPRRDLPVK